MAYLAQQVSVWTPVVSYHWLDIDIHPYLQQLQDEN